MQLVLLRLTMERDENFETLEIIVPKGATSYVTFAVKTLCFILQPSYPPVSIFPPFYVTCRSNLSETRYFAQFLTSVELKSIQEIIC
jgi:hypothetical protein